MKCIHTCMHSSSLHKQNSRCLYRLAILCGSCTTTSVLLPRERTDPSPYIAEKQCIHNFSIKWKERKCDVHAAQIRNAGKQGPAIKPHLYSRCIILHCSWLECAAAAWPSWQLECQIQCLHSAGCLFPGQHKEWLAQQPNASSHAGSQALGLSCLALREQMGRVCYFWGWEREGIIFGCSWAGQHT